MAFYGHIKSQLVLFIATELTLLGLAVIQGWVSIINSCLSNREEIVGSLLDPQAICHYVFPDNFGRRYFDLMFLSNDLMQILQIIAFLIFNNPHDCYKCLGKDPDRIYSRFQLSKEQ